MSTVRIGVSFDGFVTTGEALSLAQSAVAAGAKSLWVAEHLGYR
jgi:5,10-methylenetetrahydromethanopterin reductase